MADGPRRLRQRSVARYPFLELVEHDIALADCERTVVTLTLTDWCVAAARDTRNRWVLVRQHRHGVDAMTLEPAGGIVDPGERPADAARRELLEETGFAGGTLQALGWAYPNPALSGNRVHFFLIEGVEQEAEPQQSSDEMTEVELLSGEAMARAMRDGSISHALGLLALSRAHEQLESHTIRTRLAALEAHHERRVLDLARRLRAGLTAEDVLSPQDFVELRDPDWAFEDGQLAGVRAAKSAVGAAVEKGDSLGGQKED